jgi:hypothetical protein
MAVPLRKRVKRSIRSALLGGALADRDRGDPSDVRLLGRTGAAVRADPSEWAWMNERWKTQPPAAHVVTPQAKLVPKTTELERVDD